MSEQITAKRTAGRFGPYGGQYIPETLMSAVTALSRAYEYWRCDEGFIAELDALLAGYAGRPSLLYHAAKMTRDIGGANIYLKREDLNHTGSHKINNVLGQALLAKKMGKTRLIAETGAIGGRLPDSRRHCERPLNCCRQRKIRTQNGYKGYQEEIRLSGRRGGLDRKLYRTVASRTTGNSGSGKPPD